MLDADITGPSIPKMFGVLISRKQRAGLPGQERGGIDIMSVNLLLRTMSPLYGAAVIAGVVTQFWTDIIWGGLTLCSWTCPGNERRTADRHNLFPGRGNNSNIPAGLVSMVVEKAVKMTER